TTPAPTPNPNTKVYAYKQTAPAKAKTQAAIQQSRADETPAHGSPKWWETQERFSGGGGNGGGQKLPPEKLRRAPITSPGSSAPSAPSASTIHCLKHNSEVAGRRVPPLRRTTS